MTDVSFVVIAYNEAENIGEAITSIQALDGLPDDHEIIVVDDGSSDSTSSIVAQRAGADARVRCVVQTNQGRGAARARGIAEARSRSLVAFVDADIRLPGDWWHRCREALERAQAAGGIAIPDGDVVYVHNTVGLCPKPAPHTTTITGSNGLYRADVFDSVSFDPALRNGEDVDLNHQMVAAGMRLVCLTDLHVVHHERRGLRSSCAWLFEQGVGATRQFSTYGVWRTPDRVTVAFAVTLVLAVVGCVRSPWALTLPVALVLVASFFHLRQKFELRRTPLRSALGVVVHAPLLASYLLGRLWALVAVRA